MVRDGWHVLSDIDGSTATATCAVCGPAVSVYYRPNKAKWACRTHRVELNRIRRHRLRDSGVVAHRNPPTRDYYLRRRFGIGIPEYDALLDAQGGACGICGGQNFGRRLAVDHDHETGRVRGLLCTRCNAALGSLGDSEASLQRALDYLKRSA
jgi:hypothetical protein